MKQTTEEDLKLKKYLSMKNLGPQLVPASKEKLMISPVSEVRKSKEGDLVTKTRDNIFFEDFSEEVSRKARDSNTMSTTSFKKVHLTRKAQAKRKTLQNQRASFQSPIRSSPPPTNDKFPKSPRTSAKEPFLRS